MAALWHCMSGRNACKRVKGERRCVVRASDQESAERSAIAPGWGVDGV